MAKRKNAIQAGLVLNTKTKARGLPGKSFVHIIDLDFYLKHALSYLSNTKFLDYYISSCIKWKFRYKDRQKMTNDLINFLSVYDESRISILFNSKIVNRIDMMELLSKVSFSVERYKNILHQDCMLDEEKLYVFKTRQKWGDFIDGITCSFLHLAEKVKSTQATLISHYLRFIVTGLMKGRKGVADPNSLNADAYAVLVDMINSYNINRSKVPFSSYLVWFIKAGKNRVIGRELWNLDEGKLVSFQQVEEKGRKETKNEIIEAIEYYYRKKTSKVTNFNYLCEYLPKPFKNIMYLSFGIIEPLSPSEEVKLLVSN